MADTINSFSITTLTNHDAFGFFNNVIHQIAENFSSEPDCSKAFIASVKAFDEVLKADNTQSSAANLADADSKADKAWSNMNAYLKAMLNHPIDDIREAAEYIWHIFEKYENPTGLSYATEYGILERLLSELNEIPIDIQMKANAIEWIETLCNACSHFAQMYSLRIHDKATKGTGTAKSAKQNAINAYRDMIKMMNAMLLIAPTDELSRFAAHINFIIDEKKAAIKSRKNKSVSAE